MDYLIKNRELSWLSFNERVLQEANDKTVPLIERIKFLGIFSSNMDEFFRIRVASLKKIARIDHSTQLSGLTAGEALHQVHEKVIEQQTKFEKAYKGILKELSKEKIFLINESQLSHTQAAFVKKYFQRKVLSTMVPVMIDKIKEFPYLKDKNIYLAIRLSKGNEKEKVKHALLEIPTDVLPRFVELPSIGENKYIILLDDIIRYCLDDIFYIFNYDHYEAWTVKVTRDAELDIDNDVPGTLIDKVSQSLKQRRKGAPVRFIYDVNIPDYLLSYFTTRMHLSKQDLISGGRYHNFKDFINFPSIGSKHLLYPNFSPLSTKYLKHKKSILKVMAERDCLLHLPYNSFDFVLQFLREAAIDPKVISIRITLYRLAKNSNVVEALINAVKNGKHVTVSLELQARFDEKANIYWANKLEEEGVKVIHGIPGMKIHSKMCLITRMEKKKPVLYANIGTGNYHEVTARLYCDQSFFTSDPKVTEELKKVFDYIEFKKRPGVFKHLIVSPFSMRKKIKAYIENEIKNAQVGKEAYIIIKVNHIVDSDIIKSLYDASQAGVKIEMVVRTTCSIVPGLPGMSENITAVSIIDKLLEHSRMYVFCNNGKPKYYLSSADLMTRNLDHRVEIAFPIYDSKLQSELREILETQLKDNVKARILNEAQDNKHKRSSAALKIRSQLDVYNFLKGQHN